MDSKITYDGGDYDFRYHKPLLSEDAIDILKSHHMYDEIIGLEPELSEYTYDKWVDFVSELNKDTSKQILGFVPPASLGKFGTLAASALGAKVFDLPMNANVDDFVNAGAQFLKEQVQERMSNTSIPPGMGRDSGDTGDGGTTQANYGGGSNYNRSGLSLNLKPVDVKFVTGIVPLYRPLYYLDGLHASAPLMMKIKNVYPDTPDQAGATVATFSGDPMINRYLSSKVEADWVNLVSQKVRLNSFTNSLVNKEHLLNYYRVISYSLAVLYYYRSIDAHFRLEENRNDGMIALYQTLSVSDLQLISILAQQLDSVPLDPMVNQFMFHLFDNYKQSELPGSALLKFMPIAFRPTQDNHFTDHMSGQVTACLDMLKSSKFRNFQQIYVQAFPDSVKTKTYSYSGVPKHDPNWTSCWVNSSVIGTTSTGAISMPIANERISSIFTNLHTDAPDGWIDAANGIICDGKWQGGFGAPKFPILSLDSSAGLGFTTSLALASTYNTALQQGCSTSAYIYTNDEDLNGVELQSFFPLELKEKYQILSGNAYKIHVTVGGSQHFQRFGSEVVLPKTVNDVLQTAEEFSDIMYTPSKYNSMSMSADSFTSTEDDATSKPKRKRRFRGKK
jgi:hypothetical protein